MRPDALDLSRTNDMMAIEFLPRSSARKRVMRFIALAMLLQLTFGVLILLGLQSPLRKPMRLDSTEPMVRAAAVEIGRGSLTTTDRFLRQALDRLVASGAVFAIVIGPDGNTIDIRTGSSAGWEDIVDELTEGPDPELQGYAGAMLEHGLALYQVPVPNRPDHRVLVGVQDVASLRSVLDGGLALVAGICLAGVVILPLVYARMRRWTESVRDLHQGIQRLAQSGEPKPIKVSGHDELAFLGLAYNEMAARLMNSRNALVEANETLERKVEERTQELRDAAVKLDYMASTDMLTGLSNRRALSVRLEKMYEQSEQNSRDLYCMLIDLDGFKGVNDTLGHEQGDKVLQIAAEALRSASRSSDLVARLGGDEFMIVLMIDDILLAKSIADRIQQEFARTVGEHLKLAELEKLPSMSIGVASRKTAKTDSPEHLMRLADEALYRAKDAGKNRATFWHERRGAAAAV